MVIRILSKLTILRNQVDGRSFSIKGNCELFSMYLLSKRSCACGKSAGQLGGNNNYGISNHNIEKKW